MPLTAREFDLIIRKFGFETRDSGDLLAWLEVDGKRAVRTRRSKKSSGDLPMFHSIRQQLRLSEEELAKSIACTLGREDYIALLRSKGVV